MRLIHTLPICILLPLILSGILGVHCSQKPVAVSYVVGSGRVPVFEKPERGAKLVQVMNLNDKIEIMKVKVPDNKAKTEQAFWYEVRLGEKKGYVSYDEEILRKNITTFSSTQEGSGGMVSASALRVRKSPGLRSAILTSLERGTIVEVISMGSIDQEIDGKLGKWTEVKTPNGQVGYAFSGYLRMGSLEDLQKMSALGYEEITGYIEMKSNNAKFYSVPGKEKVTADQQGPCGNQSVDLLPQQGSYASVSQRKSDEGKTYYYLTINQGWEYGCEAGVSAWVEDKDVTYFDDMFSHSLKANVDIEKALIETVNTAIGGQLNVKSLEASELPNLTGETDASFQLVKASQGTDQWARTMFVAHRGNDYQVIGTFNSPDVRDLDGDGMMEVITQEASRAESSYTIYAYKNGSYQSVYQASSYAGSIEFKDPYVVVTSYEYKENGNRNESRSVLEYTHGEMKKVNESVLAN